MDFSFAARKICLFFILAGVINPVLASDDAYLKALEAEAHNLSVKNASPAPATTDDATKAKAAPAAPADTRKSEFETALKVELPNTFTIYNRLTPEQKSMVVETYFANDRKIAASSRQIFDFYLFDRKK